MNRRQRRATAKVGPKRVVGQGTPPPEESEDVCRSGLAARPDDEGLINQLGVLLHRQGQQVEAAACFAKVLELRPDHPEAHNNLGNALQMMGRRAEAIAHYRRAIALKPGYAEAFSNLGSALQVVGDFAGAKAAYESALALRPDLPDAHSNLGALLSLSAEMDEAARCFERALELRPDYPEANNNLGNARLWDGRVDAAIAAYERAIAQRPGFAGAHMNLGMALLSAGRFEPGWREYEWRWRAEQFSHACRPFPQPQWHGEAASGRTLLVHAEQGFGDTLQFCRLVPLLAGRGLRVILEVQPPLLRLLAHLPGVDRIVARGDDLPPFDLHCPMLSLPAALGLQVDAIPAAPYLHADPAVVARWGGRMRAVAGDRLKVGLVWAGSARTMSQELMAVDRRRSIGWERMAPLVAAGGACFFCLQKDGPRPPAEAGLIDVMGEVEDFADTAAIVANLDLLIAVDTAMVHLAGGMGRPVWVLNRFDSCWRWLKERDDSPWYPSARLFRQPSAGDWDSVIERVRAALGRVADGREDLAGVTAGGSALISTEALFAAAIADHGAGRLEAAIDAYRQVIARRPDETAARINLALAEIGLGRGDDAVRTLGRVIDRHPDRAEAHGCLGIALASLDRHAEAVAAFDRAIALKPDFAEALNNRGKSLCAIGAIGPAIGDFARAADLAPDCVEPRHNLAVARRDLLNQGRTGGRAARR